jgi:uncharacterized LabA/DUF88 family protein
MDATRYLFIDGSYAREIYRRAMEVFGATGELWPENIARQIDNPRPFRTFFYDCLDDLRRDNEGDADFKARLQSQEQYFARIQSTRALHLRLGTLTGSRRRRQKEVDVLLAVDMLTHGFNRNMTHATLLAGDLDFRPIVEALVRAGIFIEVWNEQRSASQDLARAADAGIQIRWHQMYDWSDTAFKSSHPVPTGSGSHDLIVGAQLLKKGTVGGRPVVITRVLGSRVAVLKAEMSHEVLWFEHEDEQILERYFSALHGPVEWESK